MSRREYIPRPAVPNRTWAHIDNTVFANAQDRLDKGYHEVCFGYLLAKFAAAQQQELGGCIAGIGMNGPAFYNDAVLNKFDLVSLRNWLGTLPKTDDSGKPITSGRGLLGNPYLVGCTAAKLNPLCAEFATGVGYRLPGFFENDLGEYDGGVNYDLTRCLLVRAVAELADPCREDHPWGRGRPRPPRPLPRGPRWSSRASDDSCWFCLSMGCWE